MILLSDGSQLIAITHRAIIILANRIIYYFVPSLDIILAKNSDCASHRLSSAELTAEQSL